MIHDQLKKNDLVVHTYILQGLQKIFQEKKKQEKKGKIYEALLVFLYV